MAFLYVLDHRGGHSERILDELLAKQDPDRSIVPRLQAGFLPDNHSIPKFGFPAVVFVHRGSIGALAVDSLLARLRKDIPTEQFFVVYYSTAPNETFSDPRVHHVAIGASSLSQLPSGTLQELAKTATDPARSRPRIAVQLPARALATYLCQLSGIKPIPPEIDNSLTKERNREILRDYFEH